MYFRYSGLATERATKRSKIFQTVKLSKRSYDFHKKRSPADELKKRPRNKLEYQSSLFTQICRKRTFRSTSACYHGFIEMNKLP